MIVVCGAARTGTSLAMQTLKLLGVPVPAPRFLKEHCGVEKYNPKGFYEMTDTLYGVDDHRYKGMAVKLFGYQLMNTKPHLIHKVIYTHRERENAIISYEPVKEILEQTIFSSAEIYDHNVKVIQEYLSDKDYLSVHFEEIRTNPEIVIGRVIDYLKLRPSAAQIDAAVRNVEPITINAILN